MDKLIISEDRVAKPFTMAVLSLRGTIETTNATTLEDAIDRIVKDRCFRIVVDLSDVSYISSAGWGIFISEIKRVRREAGDIKLASMRPEVREVFDLLEFNNILKPYPDIGEAIREFRGGSARADGSASDRT